MNAKIFKDPRRAGAGRAGDDRRSKDGDRRDDLDPRQNETAETNKSVSPSTPGASTDRRTEGVARPDRFSQKGSSIYRRHIWVPAVLIVVVIGMATAELSWGYISGLVTGQPTGGKYNITRYKGGSHLPFKARNPSIKPTNRTAGPAPGTNLARAMTVKDPTSRSVADTSSCPPVPKVAIWEDMTHRRVIDYVERRHGGDWYEYLDKWDKQSGRIKDIHDRGSAIRIGKNKIKIEGRQLAVYAAQVLQRATVNHCLSKLVGTANS
jgi:hypothetical protein